MAVDPKLLSALTGIFIGGFFAAFIGFMCLLHYWNTHPPKVHVEEKEKPRWLRLKTLTANELGHNVHYLDYIADKDIVNIRAHEDKVVSVTLPSSVTIKVESTAPFQKGAQAASHTKPALLENGRTVKVPAYVDVGDELVIRISDESFLNRAR
eukprot:TRINITY_DN3893_c0_g1_i1.p1 TRINITY_DN3893_c0_g1~~TRINITY_DN3893_c0_g1_i1.p1  ORF type:complete len:153 (+),score=21.66 TRINITY_DN3893_c0_g1_i1:165-623(+)